jgi:hypothetical protein
VVLKLEYAIAFVLKAAEMDRLLAAQTQLHDIGAAGFVATDRAVTEDLVIVHWQVVVDSKLV